VEVGVEVGAERLDQVDLRLEDDPPLARQVADQLGVLEALRAQPGDHRAIRLLDVLAQLGIPDRQLYLAA